MTTHTISAHGRQTRSLLRDVEDAMEEGWDVVLDLGEDASPERVIKIMEAVAGSYRVDVVVRHAELREYIDNSLTGAAIGGGAAATAVLTALAAGAPFSWPALLTAIGVGALTGGLIASALTPMSELRVYKYRGSTRVKLVQA